MIITKFAGEATCSQPSDSGYFAFMIPNADPSQDVHRPSMRRKSSAQNLLSSFKRAESSATVISPSLSSQPNALPSIIGIPSAGLSYVAPTPTTGVPRDWDVQSYSADSILSGNTVSSTTALISNGSPALGGTVVQREELRSSICKRIAALTYMRNVHDGCDIMPSRVPLSVT